MLPTRAYADNIPRLSPGGPAPRAAVDTNLALVAAVAEADVERFPAANFARYPVHTTNEALRLIETSRPRVVVVDWDAPQIDGPQVCAAARKFAQTGVLVVMQTPDRAPAALKAGFNSTSSYDATWVKMRRAVVDAQLAPCDTTPVTAFLVVKTGPPLSPLHTETPIVANVSGGIGSFEST